MDTLSHSANFGALADAEIRKILETPAFSSVAMGIEMAMFRDGATRLTTNAVDIEGRAHSEKGKKVSHDELEGARYFTHVPDEDIALRLSRFKKYSVFSYGNVAGPMLFARYLNCVKFHLRGVPNRKKLKKELSQLVIRDCLLYTSDAADE